MALVMATALFASCATGAPAAKETTTPSDPPSTTQPSPVPEVEGGVSHVEVVATDDERLVMTWTIPADEGRELWIAVADPSGTSDPVLVSGNATDIPLEEMRPSIAVGPDGRIGVAWTSHDLDVYVALSEDGVAFGPPFRLNLETRGMQVLPVIAFDRDNALHAVWLDPRDAPPQAEEPADLYLGVLAGDQYVETSLTAAQTTSVCGCCRPHIRIIEDQVTVTFRNTTEEGFRDPYQFAFGIRSPQVSLPSAVAPPTWELSGCPVAGPVAFENEVVWFDGSDGSARILRSRGPEASPDELARSEDGFRVTAAPRVVTGTHSPMLLIPGSPNARLLVHRDGEWTVGATDLPSWATNAVIWQDSLLITGAHSGSLAHEFRELP
jgi:hypothetical protein